MIPDIEHQDSVTPKQSKLTKYMFIYLIVQLVISLLPVFLFGSFQMFFSILSNFIFYFVFIGISIYTKNGCWLPLAILFSFNQLFQIFTDLGGYFQHLHFNFLRAWPVLQIY